MFGRHPLARRGNFLGKGPLAAGELLVESLGFGLDLGEPGRGFVEFLFRPRGRRLPPLGGFGRSQPRQPCLHLLLSSLQFFAKFFVARRDVGLALAVPQPRGTRLGFKLGYPRVQCGFTLVEFLLPIAKVGGQLVGLTTNLLRGRLVRHARRRRHLLGRQFLGNRDVWPVRGVDPLCGTQIRALARGLFMKAGGL